MNRLFRLNDEFLKPGHNSIGFLRLVLASLVVIEHTFVLAGIPKPGHMYAKLAVAGFFFLSGMLITQSWLHSASFLDYIWRRTLRIFPGFWACLLVSAFLIVPIGWWAEHGSLSGYLQQPAGPFAYVLRGLPMYGMHANIGSTFATNPEGSVVNGSLWTLPVEYLGYVVLAGLGLLGVLRKKPILLLLSFLPLYFWHVFPQFRIHVPQSWPLPTKLTDANVLELYVTFALGSLAYLYRERISLRGWMGAAGLVFTVFIIAFENYSPAFQSTSRALRVFALPAALLWLAQVLPLRHFDKKRDLSYGVYIYAYPIQQALVALGAAALGGWPLCLLSYALTLGMAFLSWTCIERPALRWKRLFGPKRERKGDEQIAVDPKPAEAIGGQ